MISEVEIEVGGIRTFTRRTEGEGVPTVFVHGNPTHSEDWIPFLERLDGPGFAPDLPGWGRSERPDPASADPSMNGLADFLARFLDAAGIGEYQLVCHDWGVVSLITAQAHPERVRRLVLFNVVPLLPGYRWHWIARYVWRRRFLGELANATATKAAVRLILRQATPLPGSMPDHFVERVWRGRNPGTWPQQLALYRSADPEALVAAGERLEGLTCPALILWPQQDPYLAPEFGEAYARRLPRSELVRVDGAGHWPWIDRPELVDTAVGFLNG
ncbi:MAG: alpha/beta fold hydrolase [Solirubrobacterales bacterium]